MCGSEVKYVCEILGSVRITFRMIEVHLNFFFMSIKDPFVFLLAQIIRAIIKSSNQM